MVIFDFVVKEMESLYRELIIILRKCATVTKLPVKQKVNPLTFSLKNIELDNPSRDETSQEEGSDPGKLNCPIFLKDTAEQKLCNFDYVLYFWGLFLL